MRAILWLVLGCLAVLVAPASWGYDLRVTTQQIAWGSCAAKTVTGIGGTASAVFSAWESAETCSAEFGFVSGSVPSNGAEVDWTIKRLDTNTNTTLRLYNWMYRCTSSGTFSSWTNWNTNGPGTCLTPTPSPSPTPTPAPTPTPTPGPTPPPPECPTPPGSFFSGAVFASSVNPVAEGACYMNCNVEAVVVSSVSGMTPVWQFRATGGYCSDGNAPVPYATPEPTMSTDPDDELNIACITGTSTCVIPEKPNCGYVNGEYRCLVDGDDPSMSEGSCVITESGAAFCLQDAPDTGAAGQPATPDHTQTQIGGDGLYQTWNYFNSSTVSNSTNYGGGPGSSDPRGDDPDAPGAGGGIGDEGGTCDPEVEECGDQRATSSGDCGVVPSCSDAGSVECAILRQQWRDTCRVYSLKEVSEQDVRAAAGVAPTDELAVKGLRQSVNMSVALGLPAVPGLSAAACPALPSFSFYGSSYEVDTELICDFLRYIGLFVVVVSSLVALRIAFGSN